jgi:hypothetical protein
LFPVPGHGYCPPVESQGLQDKEPFAGYAEERRPLGSYASIAAAFACVFGTLLVRAVRTGRLPERIAPADLILIGLATHRASRLLARDTVTSFIRAPFTRFEGRGGVSELNESPRGAGLRRSMGELLACPKCLDQWVAAGFLAGLIYAPRPTRAVAATFGSVALADFLQLAYAAAQQGVE